MERIFERFIGNFIRQHAEGIGISRGQIKLQGPAHSKWLVDSVNEGGKFELKPDILLLDTFESVQTIVDTKWKILRRDTEDSKNGVEQSDMYQIFAYAARFESKDSVLLYPAVDGVTPKEYDASDRGKVRKIRVETINLNCDLSRNRWAVVAQLRKILRPNCERD
jgi:5-methylcytosine-specific restriction enzyme subunit McrC